MRKTNHKLVIVKILLVIIAMLYFVFLYMDLFKIQTFISSSIIKFLSMILVLIICLMTSSNAIYSKDVFLLKIGLFITIIADIFLLLFDNHYIIGIGLFCIVQILYLIRYSDKGTKIIIRNFGIIFITLFIIYILINQFIIKIDFLIIIALYYAICLLSSTNKAIHLHKYKSYPNLNSRMIALGMILFLLCDINVALYNIPKFMVISNNLSIPLNNISPIFMWLFYLPSQVLLALSGYSYNYLKNVF